MTTRSIIAFVLIAAVALVVSSLAWRTPVTDVGVLDARIAALETKLDSMMKAVDTATDVRASNSSAATRISDVADLKVTGDIISDLAKRLGELDRRLDALEVMVKSVGALDDIGKRWKSKNPGLVDEVARSSRDEPETTLARFFMMTSRQVYELMGMPDHRKFDGEAGQVCEWHYKTGIDGTCLAFTFQTNMANRIDTLQCTLADDELKDWIKDWVRRK